MRVAWLSAPGAASAARTLGAIALEADTYLLALPCRVISQKRDTLVVLDSMPSTFDFHNQPILPLNEKDYSKQFVPRRRLLFIRKLANNFWLRTLATLACVVLCTVVLVRQRSLAERLTLNAREISITPIAKGSPTLGFDEIFVVSLPERTDRRTKMQQIAQVLGLRITFFDATKKDTSAVMKIRNEARKLAGKTASDEWVGVDYGSKQELGDLLEAFDIDVKDRDVGAAGTDLWWKPAAKDDAKETPDIKLTPQKQNPKEPFIKLELGHMALTHSMYSVLQEIVIRGLDSALIMEDDVDLEIDTERYLNQLRPSLPPTWDVLLLGFCWSKETRYPPLDNLRFGPSLRRSDKPLCLHSWAVSARGARKALNFMRHPGLAYMHAGDNLIRHLVETQTLESYSITPSLVIQTRDNPSDLVSGSNGTAWRETLQDSALARIPRLNV